MQWLSTARLEQTEVVERSKIKLNFGGTSLTVFKMTHLLLLFRAKFSFATFKEKKKENWVHLKQCFLNDSICLKFSIAGMLWEKRFQIYKLPELPYSIYFCFQFESYFD